ncbi:LLM class F420-dependent oxidoreductase [Mycolicibacterium komossense]|uniref:LLM class F420-dependent oxidoreductase n=1 Tax=Mycolicibacterium komossense TaxID=1779 RepID=A0ABT3CDZ1_9MYCO|nr:LLM class F420-dependent oxidoreductase [Mycolicibacterium komossense]MCV7227689.1 LLM class F420-dependent oxidoreductase [Mycolicibacterium komossense]
MSNNLRFGVGIRSVKSRTWLQDTARHFEDLGFDVLHVPDHLGAPAPFPVLAAAAQVTSTMRLGTFVLNAGFYKPALLARDAVDLDLVSDGRFDLGLGAGYVQEEFEAAELPFPSAGERVDHLEHVTRYFSERHSSLPILIAGNGDRVLTIAARYAAIIGLTGSGKAVADPLAERIDFVRAAAGERFDALELNIAITAAPSDDGSGIPDLRLTRRHATQLSDDQMLALPSVLSGTPRDGADKLRHLREKYGLTYFTVQDNHVDYFAKVIAELR